jgi:hypothetical protein
LLIGQIIVKGEKLDGCVCVTVVTRKLFTGVLCAVVRLNLVVVLGKRFLRKLAQRITILGNKKER